MQQSSAIAQRDDARVIPQVDIHHAGLTTNHPWCIECMCLCLPPLFGGQTKQPSPKYAGSNVDEPGGGKRHVERVRRLQRGQRPLKDVTEARLQFVQGVASRPWRDPLTSKRSMYVSSSSTRANTERPLMGSQTDIPVLAATPQDERILILGSGIGAVALGLLNAEPGRHVVCVDYSPQAIAICEALTQSSATYVVADAAEYVQKPTREPFDYIVIDLFDGPELCDFVTTERFLEATAALLAPQGALVVNTLGIPPHLRRYTSGEWVDDFDVIAGLLARATGDLDVASVPHIINRTLIAARSGLAERLDTSGRTLRTTNASVVVPARIPSEARKAPVLLPGRSPRPFTAFRDEVRAAKRKLADQLFPSWPERSLNQIVESVLGDDASGPSQYQGLAAAGANLAYMFASQYHTTSWQRRRTDWSWFDPSIPAQGTARDYFEWHYASARNAVRADEVTYTA